MVILGTPTSAALAAAKQAKTLFPVSAAQLIPSITAALQSEGLDTATIDKQVAEFEKDIDSRTQSGRNLASHISKGQGLWRGELSRNMNELRFIFCSDSSHSEVIREFVTKEYPDLKYHNPLLPMLVREAVDAEPKIIARYDFSREIVIPVEGFTYPMLWESLFVLNLRGKLQQTRSAESNRPTDYIVDRPRTIIKPANLS